MTHQLNLNRVTITGADDSVSPISLARLSCEFPYVEWGILVSSRSFGAPRFPSRSWISDLQFLQERIPEIKLSLHLCGAWVKALLAGNIDASGIGTLRGFSRVQLNFHGEALPWDPDLFPDVVARLFPGMEVIFQIDGQDGAAFLGLYLNYHSNGVPLFDTSHGAGVVPKSWPKPIWMDDNNTDTDYCPHGYAGGLGPDNLATQLPLIAEASRGCRIWIDMETKVRTRPPGHNSRESFDLDKVRKCLEITQLLITLPMVLES